MSKKLFLFFIFYFFVCNFFYFSMAEAGRMEDWWQACQEDRSARQGFRNIDPIINSPTPALNTPTSTISSTTPPAKFTEEMWEEQNGPDPLSMDIFLPPSDPPSRDPVLSPELRVAVATEIREWIKEHRSDFRELWRPRLSEEERASIQARLRESFLREISSLPSWKEILEDILNEGLQDIWGSIYGNVFDPVYQSGKDATDWLLDDVLGIDHWF